MGRKRNLEAEIGELVMNLARRHEGASVTWTPDWGFTITSADGAKVISPGGASKSRRPRTEAA